MAGIFILDDLKIVNNAADRNKYIHFELSKVLIHWFSAQNYPEAEKSGLK